MKSQHIHNISKTQLKKSSLAMTKTFSDEIANDQIKSALYINRAIEAITQLGENDAIALHEKYAVDLYKRALLLIGAGDIKLLDDNGNTNSGAENNLPISSYLSHGSRVMVEIPAGSNNTLANWLSSGNPYKDNFSSRKTQIQAIHEEKLVYTRLISTHKVDITSTSDNQYVLTEKQGFFIGLKSFFMNILGKTSKHFGVELALDAQFNEQNSKGDYVKYPDGEHGHLYIYYKRPTEIIPGSMLIGIENANPMSVQHSKLGTPNIFSPIGGTKFNTLAIKKYIEQNPLYNNTIIPKTIGGMKITLSYQSLEEIIKINDNNYGIELAYAKPTTSVNDLQNSLVQLASNLSNNNQLPYNFSELQNIFDNAQQILDTTGQLPANHDSIM